MSEWKRYKLSELYEMSSGISSTKEQAGHGSPFLSFSVVFNNYFLPDSLIDLMDTTDGEKQKYSINEGDIFLTRTSETVDELAMSSVALKDYPEASFSGFLKRLRPVDKTIVYPKFMAFYLRSPLFRRTIINNTVMTLRASFNEAMFSYLEIMLPDFDTQKKIGDFLYSLEKKKQINNQINQELEAMAKTLYNYWFVQFDFPDQNGKPYKSSGGKMFYHPELKREIPEGWGVEKLGELIELERGVTYAKSDIVEKTTNDAIGVLRATNITGNVMDLNDLVYLTKDKINNKQILKQNETLIVMSSGSKEHLGKNAINYYEEVIGFGAFCSKIVPKKYSTYINTFLQSSEFKGYLLKQSMGTNINNLTNSDILDCRIILPNEEILDKFENMVEKNFKLISNNYIQNQQLTQLRDWLLPMLMNGQVKVE